MAAAQSDEHDNDFSDEDGHEFESDHFGDSRFVIEEEKSSERRQVEHPVIRNFGPRMQSNSSSSNAESEFIARAQNRGIHGQ